MQKEFGTTAIEKCCRENSVLYELDLTIGYAVAFCTECKTEWRFSGVHMISAIWPEGKPVEGTEVQVEFRTQKI